VSGLVLGAIIGLLLLVLLVIGVPVAFALGLTAMISILIFLTMGEFGYFANFVFSSLNSFALLAIPLFILMGAIFGQSQASRDLLEAAHMWVGRLRGGLAMSSVVACSVFAALTGSSPATSAAIGRIAIPEMKKRGYPNTVSTGAIVGGGDAGYTDTAERHHDSVRHSHGTIDRSAVPGRCRAGYHGDGALLPMDLHSDLGT
jgi:C4-dicarboxylate transporter, DctM subunit